MKFIVKLVETEQREPLVPDAQTVSLDRGDRGADADRQGWWERRETDGKMEIDGDSKLERIFEQFALSLNQHSKLTAISVDFINMERHKSMHEHTLCHFEAHTHTHTQDPTQAVETE